MVIWPWPKIFMVKFWKCSILGLGGPIDMERKGCESIGCYTHFVTFNFDSNHDLDLEFSRSNFEKAVSREWRWPIDMEWKGCESIGCWTHVVTFKIHLTHDLELGFSMKGQILKKLYFRNGMTDWLGTKGMWIDRMLDPCCGFQHSPLPWPWPWIFKVNILKCCISGMGWLIDLEWKGCESIKCWTHVVTFDVQLNHDLDLGFSRSNFLIAIDRNARAHRHWTKAIWVDRVLYLLCGLQLWSWPWIF